MAISQSNLPQFISKLYNILSDPRYHSYIQWGPEGKSFIIIDPTEFSNSVLSEHFKHSNMSSFVRQLNKYDFHKVKSDEASKMKYGPGMWEFAHKNFCRGRMDLIGQITRKPSMPEHGTGRHHEHMGMDQEYHYNSVFYNYMVNTMSSITKYFEMISEDLRQIRKNTTDSYQVDAKTAPKVLIAEDNAACAKYAAAIFKRSNYITVSAESVNELHFLLTNTCFEMILISNSIPDVTEIIKSIRVKNPSVPIILTAEDIEKTDTEMLRYLNVDKVLVKPFLHEELVDAIKQRSAISGLRSSKEYKHIKGQNSY